MRQRIRRKLRQKTKKTLDQSLLALQHPVIKNLHRKLNAAYRGEVDLQKEVIRLRVVQSIFARAQKIRRSINPTEPAETFRNLTHLLIRRRRPKKAAGKTVK